jgi:hypothetical protein
MILTNRLNLPLPIVRAVEHDPYTQDGHISVTELIQPPRVRQLLTRHRESISVDVADRVWALLGSNVHYILERAKVDNAFQEERISTTVKGWTVTGQTDLFYNHIIRDYKITSVYAVLNGIKPEWSSQINLYAELWRSKNFRVDGGEIIAILRDWSKFGGQRSSDYPQYQIMVLPVELWDPIDAGMYLEERVTVHQEAEHLADDDLPVCTAEERWEKPTQYAVKKRGNKKASRLLPTLEEAEVWARDNMKDKPFEIVCRPGESVRCRSYCDCSNYCNWWQEHKKEEVSS